MRKYFTAFQMTQSMFCSIPFPCREWDEKSRPYMLLFLPLIGLEIGAVWWLFHWVLGRFQIGGGIYGILMCGWPYLATGFIHLDGFMDVTDAVCSWRSLEKRREILKDSHVGSFAVVWCVFLILAGYSAFSYVSAEHSGISLLLVPMLSRCCSALAIMQLKTMSTSQYAGTAGYAKGQKLFLVLWILLCLAGGFLNSWKTGLVCLAVFLGYGVSLISSYRSLDGMNGDISGFCICISELCGAAAFALL